MRAPLLAVLAATLVLSACSGVRQSRLNPINWFGGSTEQRVAVVTAEEVDPRPLVAEVTEMAVERMPGGAIVRAKGLPARQGYWDADLVADTAASADGVLVYQFRVAPPAGRTPAGTPPSREVTAGTFLSDQDLLGVRTIVVRGTLNQRSARR